MFFYDFTTSHILFVSGYNTKCYFPINISIIEYKLLLRLRFHVCNIPVNPPLFAGVSRVRALSPAWTGSHAWETLISRTHIFLQHDIPPTKNQVQ